MRFARRLVVPVLAALAVTACGLLKPSQGRDGDHGEDSTEFAVPLGKVPTRHFQEYRSPTGWTFIAEGRGWIEASPRRTPSGIPVRTLVRADDRKTRISFYEAELPADSAAAVEARVNGALAYLFKADPVGRDSSAPVGARFALFRPPRDTLRHFGLAFRSGMGILFVHLESKSEIPDSLMGELPGIRMESPGSRTALSPSAAPDSARRSFLGAIKNTWGLKAVEDSSWQAALGHFKAALGLDPSQAGYLLNCAAMFQVRKQHQAGIDFLSRHPGLLGASADLAGAMGAMHEELGRYGEAKSWALKALEIDPAETEWLINLSDALWGLGERVHSKNVLLRRHAEKPTFRLSVYLASTYLGLEEYANAKRVLQAAHRDTAPSPKSAEYYLRALAGLNEYEAALDFARELGPDFPATSNNHLLKGVCEFNLKLYRLAMHSAKASLALDPANREAQQLSTQISALIGDRSNLILRTPIPPLRTQAAFKAAKELLKDPENQKLASRHAITLLTQNIVYSWAPRTRWKRTRHQVFHIREGRRLLRFSELTFELNPGYSRFYVNRFRLYDASFRMVEEQKVSDFYVTKTHSSTLHPENLLVHLPVKARPGVQFLEVIATEEAQVPSAEFPYLRYDHAFSYPVLRSTYEILRPPRHLLVSVYGQARIDSLPDRIAVRMDEPTLPYEPSFSPAHDEFGTGFSATPYATWREVGADYRKSLEKAGIHLDSVPFLVRERAQEIVDMNRGMHPVHAMYRYVRDSVRYNNYEFSRHALIPEKAETVLANGYTDCKGHALLLMQLLKARDIEARLCLVSQVHTGDLDQPSLHQFNHMIVHVPAQKGVPQHFLDPTEKHHPFRRSPLALEGKNVLVIDRGDLSRMATIPELDSANEHQVQIFHALRAGQDQVAEGSDSLILTGKVATEFRAHMRAWNPSTRYENLLSWLTQSYSNFYDERFRILGEEDPDLPLVLVLRYKRKFPFKSAMQEFQHYPSLELSFLRFPNAGQRQGPTYFPHAIQINSQWVYEMPPGYGWKSLTLDRELSENHLHWLFSISQSAPETIVIKQNWRVDPFVATAEEYGRFQSGWNPILSGSGLRLMISQR
jgi:tetratricopeptide (TPR) repeat protein